MNNSTHLRNSTVIISKQTAKVQKKKPFLLTMADGSVICISNFMIKITKKADFT